MFRLEGITGVEFCSESELVDNEVMEQLGFKITEITGCNGYYGKNVTAYFYKDDAPYVYAECYIAKLEAYTKLVIDKKTFDKLGMKDNAVCLNTGKGDGTRAVPSVRYNDKMLAIHKYGHEGKEVDHKHMSLNLITDESLRECSTLQNSRNKINLHTWGTYLDGTFYVHIREKNGLLSESDIEELRREDFSVKINKNYVNIEKGFEKEIDAIKTLRAYEEKYYGEYAFNPLNDMRGHIDAKIDQLIFGTKSEDDVIREILADYANDAVFIARYNLEKEYESREINYNHGNILENGRFVA